MRWPPLVWRGLVMAALMPWGTAQASAGTQAPAALPAHLQGVDDAYDEGTNSDKRPFKAGRLKSVAITADGRRAWDGAPTPDDCKGFVPSQSMLREYFGRAQQVSAQEYRHGEAPWSHCQATGSFVFRDGRQGGWAIQQHGLGYLVVGGKRSYFYCEACGLTGFGAADLVDAYQRQMAPP